MHSDPERVSRCKGRSIPIQANEFHDATSTGVGHFHFHSPPSGARDRRPATGRLAAAAFLAAAVLCACRGGDPAMVSAPGAAAETPGQPATVPAHPTTPAFGAVAEVDLVWSVPDGWVTEEPSSAMRKAQYLIPAEAGDREGGECAVFYFGPGQGGDVRGNVERWASQFKDQGGGMVRPAVTEVLAGGLAITRVEVKGTYTPSTMTMGGGAAPAARPRYLLLGAIVPAGKANWFFRCTGPEKTMGANRARFDSLLASIRPAV